jgi:hypothetical protein
VSLPLDQPLAVLDSSVLVPVWSRLVLQQLAAPPRRRFLPVWSEWIIAETWRVLTWRHVIRTGRTSQSEWQALSRSANAMLRYLAPVMQLVSFEQFSGPPAWPGLADPDDEPVWATAAVAGAAYVVSQNIADFPPLTGGRHTHAGIEYVTAIEFIEDVLGEAAERIYFAPLPGPAQLRSQRLR